MASEPILTAHFVNLSHQPVSLCVSSIVVRQRLCKKSSGGNEYTKEKKNCLTRRFLYDPCSIKEESVPLFLYPPLVARQWLGKHIPATTKNCWRCRFLCGPCRIKGKQAIRPSQNFLFKYAFFLMSESALNISFRRLIKVLYSMA
jgi:hypothetical protein